MGYVILARLLPISLSVLAGCLYAPPLAERVEEQYAPVVRSTSPDPNIEEHVVVAPAEPMEFRIDAVEDPNLDDTLYARWFLDAEPGDPSIDEHIQRPTGDPVRSTSWLVSEIPCDHRGPDGTFFVEAIISDRPFDPSIEPKFRGLPDEALSVHLGWRVRIDEAAVALCQ